MSATKAEPQAKAAHTPSARYVEQFKEGWIVLEGEGTMRRRLAFFYYREDAKQFAAFPELLKQAKSAVDFCKLLMESINERAGHEAWNVASELKEERAAIAKAEGHA